MRGATPGVAVTRIAGYPGGIIRVAARSGQIAASGIARVLGAVACNPYAIAIQELLLNPTALAGTGQLRYEMPVFPPGSPEPYYLPRGTYILPNGQVYVPLPESIFGPSDFQPPPGSIVVTRDHQIIGQSVGRGARYPADSIAPISSLPWVLLIPPNMTEAQARSEYLQYLQQGQRNWGNSGRTSTRTMDFTEWLNWRYVP